jgi:probable blue pigment (indigoidine) exporter
MRSSDLILTATAPAIWGSTYIVTTSMLPQGYPITLAALRALPVGILMLICIRKIPPQIWRTRIIALSILNIGIMWPMLFVAAQRLPGGQAATLGALQPIIVIVLSRILLGTPILALAIMASLIGILGVSTLVLNTGSYLDPIGLIAAMLGTISMATGTVLYRRWNPPMSPIAFTAWQLTVGGTILAIMAILIEPETPQLTLKNFVGIGYLGFIGAGITLVIWHRGITRLSPTIVSTLGLLSPMTAVLLGWGVLNESLTIKDWIGVALILSSVWLCQWAIKKTPHSTLHKGVTT